MDSKYRRQGRADTRTAKLLLIILLAAGSIMLFKARYSRPEPPRPIECVRSSQDVDAIKVNPAMTEIRPAMAESESGTGERFEHMLNRLECHAAINGTFYDRDLKPLGDILVDGKLVNKGHYPNAFAVKDDGTVAFIRGTKRRIDWTGCKSGIAAGPMLVRDGRVALDPNADGFTKRSLELSARRSGLGITKDGKLLMVTASRAMTLREFAQVMLDLGAVDAMNLDGGGACGLYMADKVFATPGLPMTNILAVYRKDLE